MASEESFENVISLSEAESSTASSTAEEVRVTTKATTSSATALLKSLLSIRVENLTFVGIAKHGVGFTDFFEHLACCLLIVRIFVRVPLNSELAIGFLDGVFVRATVQSKHCVIVV